MTPLVPRETQTVTDKHGHLGLLVYKQSCEWRWMELKSDSIESNANTREPLSPAHSVNNCHCALSRSLIVPSTRGMVARTMQSTTLFTSSGPHESRAAICPDSPGGLVTRSRRGQGSGPPAPPQCWEEGGAGNPGRRKHRGPTTDCSSRNRLIWVSKRFLGGSSPRDPLLNGCLCILSLGFPISTRDKHCK